MCTPIHRADQVLTSRQPGVPSRARVASCGRGLIIAAAKALSQRFEPMPLALECQDSQDAGALARHRANASADCHMSSGALRQEFRAYLTSSWTTATTLGLDHSACQISSDRSNRSSVWPSMGWARAGSNRIALACRLSAAFPLGRNEQVLG